MKWKSMKVVAVCAALSLTAQMAAIGADTQPKSQGKQSSQQKLRGSKAKGMPVTSNTGENVGVVEEIIIDPESGQVEFVILNTQGAAGSSQKLTPVPWEAVDVSDKGFSVNQDKQKLQSAPTTTSGHLTEQTPAEVIAIYEFYAVPVPASAGGTGTGTTSGQQGRGQTGQQQDQQRQQQQDQNRK